MKSVFKAINQSGLFSAYTVDDCLSNYEDYESIGALFMRVCYVGSWNDSITPELIQSMERDVNDGDVVVHNPINGQWWLIEKSAQKKSIPLGLTTGHCLVGGFLVFRGAIPLDIWISICDKAADHNKTVCRPYHESHSYLAAVLPQVADCVKKLQALNSRQA